MTEIKSNKVELSPKARQALEIEAALRRMSLKDLASELILCSISKKTLKFIEEERPKVQRTKEKSASRTQKSLEKDANAIAKIKELWAAGVRNKAEIARQLPGFNPRTVRYWIDRALERGDLPQEDKSQTTESPAT